MDATEYENGYIKIYEIESGILLEEIEIWCISISILIFSPIQNTSYVTSKKINSACHIKLLEEYSNNIPSYEDLEYNKIQKWKAMKAISNDNDNHF